MKKNETRLLSSEDFKNEWYALQREVLKKMVDNEIVERQKQLNKTAADARKNVEEIEYAFG